MTYDAAVTKAKSNWETFTRCHPDGASWEVERQQRYYVVMEEPGDYHTASYEDTETYDLGSPIVFDASTAGWPKEADR